MENKQVNILFMGTLYNSLDETVLLKNSKVGLQVAANTFQWNCINGLEECCPNNSVTIYNVVPVGTFPKHYKKLILKSRKWSNKYNDSHFEIGCINLPLIKQYMRTIRYKKAVINWINETKGEKHIIAYGLYQPFLEVLKYVKNKNKDVSITLIVADLVGSYGIYARNLIIKLIQKNQEKKVYNGLPFIDSFVILTEQMKEPLKIGDKPYVVVEGIVNEKTFTTIETVEQINSNEKVILYTGTLKREFGIQDLLQTFKFIKDDNIKLWIAGSGEMQDEILDMSKKDNRIKFFGHLAHDEVIRILRQSNVLVNPRNNQGEYTKYSFPSKTMEYMLSGKPVIMHKLDGIPDEYDEYLTYFTSNSPEVMAREMIDLLNKDRNELKYIGEKAKKFLISNKTSMIQGEKIICLLRTNR